MNYKQLTLWQAVRRWPRATWISVCLTLNILLWGYDTGIVGGMSSLVAFRKEFGVKEDGEWIIAAVWLAVWSAGFHFGSMTGAAIGGWIQDRTGRKSTLGLGCLLSIAAITICYVADQTSAHQAAYLGGKITQGVAVGVLICSTQTYLSELVPPRLRGPIMAFFPAFQLLGQLIAAVMALSRTGIDGPASYRVAIASEYPLSLVPLVLAIMLPESPVWLIRKNKMAVAQAAFRKFHGAQVADAHQDLFEDMSKALTEEAWNSHKNKATYFDCFRGTNLRRTMIVIFVNGMPELMGFPILGNVSYILQLLGLSEMASFIVAIAGILLGIGGNIGSFFTLLRFGRRRLILVTLSVISVFWLSIGVAGCFKGVVVGWYAAAGMMVVIVFAGVGCWPASFVVATETSSLTLRSKTSGAGWLLGGFVTAGFGLGTPYLYNTDAGNLGAKTAFIFFGTSAIAVALTYLFVPELKGLSSVEIDRVFEKHGGSVRRANTSDFERVDSNDKEIPLTNLYSNYSRESATDGASLAGSSLHNAPAATAWEPLRRRPTF